MDKIKLKNLLIKSFNYLTSLLILANLLVILFLKSYISFELFYLISIFLVAITFIILNKIDNKKISIKKKNTILTLLVISLFIVFIFKNLKI